MSRADNVYKRMKDWCGACCSKHCDDCDISIIVNALEQQKPRKPIEDGYNDLLCVCPTCGNSDLSYDNSERFKYCPECGQRIDWSK